MTNSQTKNSETGLLMENQPERLGALKGSLSLPLPELDTWWVFSTLSSCLFILLLNADSLLYFIGSLR